MTRRPRVRAVRRYRPPQYPSHTDPDPTREPYPIPYPLAPRVASALLVAGVAAGCSSRPVRTSNPFASSFAGLPHHASMFGTGEPSRLDSERARELIHAVFQDEGFALLREVRVREPGFDLVVDGYDPERRVGFVYADWERLDSDALVSWGETPSVPEKVSLPDAEALDREAQGGRKFVALITPFDARFEHYQSYSLGPLARALDKLGILTDDMRTRAYEQAQERAVDAVFRELEEEVRDYIAWARANGAI